MAAEVIGSTSYDTARPMTPESPMDPQVPITTESPMTPDSPTASGAPPTDGSGAGWRAPALWRALLALARIVAVPMCRLRVTGDLSPALRTGPALLAVNHIGPFDPIAFAAACRVRRITPRLMATGGLFRAPVVGSVMRACGHIRVNRRHADVADAIEDAAGALAQRSLVAGYPEGRITLDPGMWPERGKTGLARLALRSGVAVVPVAQWGAHEVVAWGGVGPTIGTVVRSLWRRPVVRVHFGAPVDLTDLVDGTPGAAQRATDRIIDAITAELVPLRVEEPRLPRYIDPVRPVTTGRRHRGPAARPL